MSDDQQKMDLADAQQAEIEARILQWVDEAIELRFGIAGDHDGHLDPSTVDFNSSLSLMHMLERVRLRESRVDGLLVEAMRAQAKAKRAAKSTAYHSRNQYDESMRIAADRRREYVSADELKAEANLGSLVERHKNYQAERLLLVADEAVEVIKQISYQFNRWRNDLHEMSRARRAETMLDR